jgi:anti-sigma28 factor (negative regulator of flagellin synthesis)
MPEVPHIGSGLASVVNRGHDAKVLSPHTGPASTIERPGTRDRVEISPTAHRLERLVEAKEVRAALVERIRQQIADGTYESEQRLTDATERLLRELEA